MPQQAQQATAQHSRHTLCESSVTVRLVSDVSAEEFIGALAAQRDRDMLAAKCCEKPDRQSTRIGQRLVVPGTGGAAGGGPVELIDATLENGDVLFARAGPRRVPTRFYMASPELDGQTVDFAWPVEGRVISSFGKRRRGWHAGMDIKAEIGRASCRERVSTIV